MLRLLRTVPLLLVLAASSFFTACGGSNHTKLRLVHAIPDGQAIDVVLDGKTVETAVPFDTATPSGGYLSVSSGTRHLQLFPTGTTTGAYFDGNISLSSGSTYTIVATGAVGNNTVVAPLFTDNTTTPTSSNAALRVIHASPSGPTPVDVYLSAPNTTTLGSPSIASLAFPTASNYVTVPAGSYAVLVTPAGLPAIDIDLPDQAFSTGKIYTYVLVDVQNGGTLSGTPLILNDN